MRAFVTGGAGFIGSNLVRALLRQGHAVDVLDDLSTGSAGNLADLKSIDRFSLVIDSLENRSAVARFADEADCVFHLAAAVGVRYVIDHPIRTIETNVRGTEIVLDAAARTGTPVFIASSSEVYGKSARVPFGEEDDLSLGATSNPRWSYACSKAMDEIMALAYHRERGLPVVVGRLFNTTGAGQTGRYGMVLPTFARQAVESLPITVFGDGAQTRCFCHVDDTVRAIIGLMAESGCHGQVFNIGTTREVSIADLAGLVRDTAKSRSAIEFVPYDVAYAIGFEDMARRVPDIGRITRRIGWRSRISLERLVRDVVDRAREDLSRPASGIGASLDLAKDAS